MWQKLVSYAMGAFLKYVLGYLENRLPAMVKEWKDKKQRELDQAKAQAALDVVVKNPSATAEERARAYEAFINSGN